MSTAPDVKGQFNPRTDPHIPTDFFSKVSGILVPGTNISITPNPVTSKITIASSGGGIPSTRTISAGTGLTGGGDLSADRTLAFDTTWGDIRYAQLGVLNAFSVRPTFNGNIPWDSGNLASPISTNQIREKLTADRTYYVRTDGNDSNTGLANTSGGAFLTGQAALNVAATIDFNGYTVTIQFGNGTYAGAMTIPRMVGQSLASKLVLRGDPTTPSNVVFSYSVGFNSAIVCGAGASARVDGIKFTGTSNTFFLLARDGGLLEFQNTEFGGSAWYQIYLTMDGIVRPVGNYTISAGAVAHIGLENGGRFDATGDGGGATITLTGTPDFSGFAFLAATVGSIAVFNQPTFIGSATGPRYLVDSTSHIQTYGGGATYLPGNSAGSGANYS